MQSRRAKGRASRHARPRPTPAAKRARGGRPRKPHPRETPPECFLSYAHADEWFAELLEDVLRYHGVETWFSAADIVGAEQWHDEIGKALERCDWFLVVLSPDAVESMWVKREVLFALNETRLHERIIPVLLRDCDYKRLSWHLKSIQMVDFRSDHDSGFRDLLRIWDKGYCGQIEQEPGDSEGLTRFRFRLSRR